MYAPNPFADCHKPCTKCGAATKLAFRGAMTTGGSLDSYYAEVIEATCMTCGYKIVCRTKDQPAIGAEKGTLE
jgi:hypothetical protein